MYAFTKSRIGSRQSSASSRYGIILQVADHPARTQVHLEVEVEKETAALDQDLTRVLQRPRVELEVDLLAVVEVLVRRVVGGQRVPRVRLQQQVDGMVERELPGCRHTEGLHGEVRSTDVPAAEMRVLIGNLEVELREFPAGAVAEIVHRVVVVTGCF